MFRFENLPIYLSILIDEKCEQVRIYRISNNRAASIANVSDFSRRANVEEIDANRGKSESGNESTSASAVFLAIDRFRIENNTQFVRASFFSPPLFFLP